MELLVNPYTKNVFPEHGPNMMWNLKYSMHYNGGMMGGSGMMGGRNMMNGTYDDDYFDNSNILENNEINSKEAYNEGVSYLLKRSETLTLSETYHEFYGYFTFHVEKDGEPAGMLSVNGITGDVWYHDWHGELIEIIEGHEADVH